MSSLGLGGMGEGIIHKGMCDWASFTISCFATLVDMAYLLRATASIPFESTVHR